MHMAHSAARDPYPRLEARNPLPARTCVRQKLFAGADRSMI